MQPLNTGRELLPIEYILNKLTSTLSFVFPNFAAILICDNNEYVTTRRIYSFFVGTLYALLIWYLTVFGIKELSQTNKIVLLAVYVTIISISMTINARIKCIMTVATFNFVAKAGKVIMISYIVSGILNGPISNVFQNANELGRSIMCQHRLLSNFTNVQKSSLKSNKAVIEKLLLGDKEMKSQQKHISGLISGLKNELNDPDQSRNKSKNKSTAHTEELHTNSDRAYYEKNLERCMKVLTSGAKKCLDNMKTVEKKVRSKIGCSFCLANDMNIDKSCSFKDINTNNKS